MFLHLKSKVEFTSIYIAWKTISYGQPFAVSHETGHFFIIPFSSMDLKSKRTSSSECTVSLLLSELRRSPLLSVHKFLLQRFLCSAQALGPGSLTPHFFDSNYQNTAQRFHYATATAVASTPLRRTVFTLTVRGS